MTCTRQADLGLYLLGALDRTERARLEAHLPDCEACRAELDRLAPLPGLLSRLPADEAAHIDAPHIDGPAPPWTGGDPAILDRVLDEVARRRRRSRLAWVAAAAVAVLLAAGGGATAVLSGDDDRPAAAPLTAAATDPRTGVHARVALRERPWGTRVDLRLAGVRPGQRCRLVARIAGGRSEVAATWRASYHGTASVPGAVGVPPSRVRGLDVVAAADRRLVSVPVPGR